MKLKKHKEPIKWLLISSLSALFVCYLAYNPLSAMNIADQRDISKVIISLFGTILGFLFALLAIIMSLSSTRLIKNMNITGHYANLMLSCKILSCLLFLTIMTCLFCLFYITPLVFIGITGLAIFTAIFAFRTAYKFFLILSNIN